MPTANPTDPSSIQDRVVLFARNQELALYFGNNYVPVGGTNTFGQFLQTSVPLPNNWTPGSWHHIAMRWEQGGYEQVYVDGVPSSVPYLGWLALDSQNWMFFGSNRFRGNISNGFPLTADATISSVRIYSNPNVFPFSSSFLPPDRYDPGAQNFYEGTLMDFGLPELTGYDMEKRGTLGSIQWTERIPASGGDVALSLEAQGRTISNVGKDQVGGTTSSCHDVNELGQTITHTNPDDCWSLTGGASLGVVSAHTNAFDFSPDGMKAAGSTDSRLRYRLDFTLPSTVPVKESPIVEDVTVTWVTQPKVIVQWFE